MTVNEMQKKYHYLKNCANILCNDCPIKNLCVLTFNQNDIKQWLLQEVEE